MSNFRYPSERLTKKCSFILMRNTQPGTTKFDVIKICNANAKEIAEYVLKTFK